MTKYLNKIRKENRSYDTLIPSKTYILHSLLDNQIKNKNSRQLKFHP